MVKNPSSNAEDTGSIPGPERSPGEGNGNLLQYSCLGQRNLLGYIPWDIKRVRHDLVTKQKQVKYISKSVILDLSAAEKKKKVITSKNSEAYMTNVLPLI